MRKGGLFLSVPVFCTLILCACDLQPKIASIPDNIGMFIESRYPAMLADPQSQPEIYNSAVTDYGVYASPELYGSSRMEDYVLYASADDYVLVPEVKVINVDVSDNTKETVVEETTVEQESVAEFEESEIMSEYLVVPLYGGNTVLDEINAEEIAATEETPVEQKTEPISEQKIESAETKTVESKPVEPDTIIVERGDTLYALAKKNNMTVAEMAKINDLHEPYNLSIGQKLKMRVATTTAKTETVAKPAPAPAKPIPNVISEETVKQIKAEKTKNIIAKETVKPTSTTRVDLQEITVAKGDTLYSISRQYKIPVNDLAIMNKLSAPFNLSVGQKLKVPKLDGVQTRPTVTVKKTVETKKVADKKSTTTTSQKTTAVSQSKTVDKTTTQKTNATKTTTAKTSTPKIAPRSNSKFSWPVRGKILSGYGPKNGGLVNDGINISAPLGTIVRAAENGVVAYAGNEVKGMGNLIIIQHSDGWMTVYAHLNSMDVRRGARVSVGQPIGKIGKTGKVDKPQLHFEIRKGTKSYNPTNYLKK